MGIQLSSNSNEALRLTIMARPTPVGQYRQAYLQYSDRVSALKACELNLKRAEVKLRLKEAEKKQILELIEVELNPNKIEALKANYDLIDLDCQEVIQQTQDLSLQIEDAQREAILCEQMMHDICETAGVNFGKLNSQEFQNYMVEETKQFQARKMAAALLSSSTGLSPMVTETLLELPKEERLEMLKLQSEILEEHNKLMLSEQNNNSNKEFNKLDLVEPEIRFLR